MEKMSIKELLDVLRDLNKLLDELETSADFLHKDDVQQYLRWTAKNIAETVWRKEREGL